MKFRDLSVSSKFEGALLGAIVVASALAAGPAFAQGKGGGGTTPPPNPEIAYADSASGIRVMNADGTNSRLVVSGKNILRGPCWSPSGTKLAYHDTSASGGGIWTVNLDGTAKTRVAAFAANGLVTYPDWSRGFAPDGKEKIAFVVAAASGYRDVYICNPDGTGLLNVTNTPTVNEHASMWTRDSSKLVVTRQVIGAQELVQLELGMVNGSLGVVSQTTLYSGGAILQPRWANTSDTVAFSGTFGSYQRIWLLDVPSGASHLVTNVATADERWPSFSPDDSKIAFVRGSGGIRIVNADGTGEVLISSKGTDPYWKR